jgi:hypothetical protein
LKTHTPSRHEYIHISAAKRSIHDLQHTISSCTMADGLLQGAEHQEKGTDKQCEISTCSWHPLNEGFLKCHMFSSSSRVDQGNCLSKFPPRGGSALASTALPAVVGVIRMSHCACEGCTLEAHSGCAVLQAAEAPVMLSVLQPPLGLPAESWLGAAAL